MSDHKPKSPLGNQIFTKRQLVGHICNLCEPALSDYQKKVFEPGCGSGNFLVEVLHRRLLVVGDDPQKVLITLSNLYGIDIDEKLVLKTRQRLRSVLSNLVGESPKFTDDFFALVDKILIKNIIVGDLLADSSKVVFYDWLPQSTMLVFHSEAHSLAEILQAASPSSTTITLRPEQKQAIAQTYVYWQKHHSGDKLAQFLWNAKPRFGKTFTAYQFSQRIGAQRILVVSNRPAISDAWAKDFFQSVESATDYIFASTRSADVLVDGKKHHIYSRSELLRDSTLLDRPFVFFISLQDLKGKNSAQDDFKAKNQWIFRLQQPWDLLIIDESHEGVQTPKTSQALAHIRANFTLHLSGTPFRALGSGDFTPAQIYNWSYLDEQKAKAKHSSDPENPYFLLPELRLFAYNLKDFFAENTEITSTELFRTRNGQFLHPELVEKWLDLISQNSDNSELSRSLPFTSAPAREYHRHTFWLLSHVDQCRALAKILNNHHFFKNYEVAIVAGKDDVNSYNVKSALARVRKAITSSPETTRTITLSCGRLTTGITIPEWTAILMLGVTSDLQKFSSAQYLQAAFRAQNPWPSAPISKDFADLYDWSPDRAMLALRDYAVNLCSGQNTNPELAIKELLQVFPAFLSSARQRMLPLSASQIVELPTQLVAEEIVDSGFAAVDKLFSCSSDINFSPVLQRVISKFYALGKHGFESPRSRKKTATRPQDPLNVVKTQTSQPNRSHKKPFAEAYYAKLRGFSAAIPFLAHLYGQPDQNFSDLIAVTPEKIFEELVGITKSDYQILEQNHFFAINNCTVAIREFLSRERSLSRYYNSENPDTIFKLIPLQRQYVFTPLFVVERMLDYLEQQRPGLFCSSERTFLDLCSKSGLFSAAVVRRLFLNLRSQFPRDHDCLLHILTRQVYTWSPNLATRQSTVQTVLSSLRFNQITFSTTEIAEINRHFVTYNPSNGKEVINYVRVMQKIAEFWENDVKFDVILGNPPYQSGRRQVYADFYRLAADLDPELLCLIFPLGWQKVTNMNGLKQLNNPAYKRDPHLVLIDNYYEKGDQKIFPEIGTGGVNIILRDRSYDNHGRIRKLEQGQSAGHIVLPVIEDEIEKPRELDCLKKLTNGHSNLASLGSRRQPYGISANFLRNSAKNSPILHSKKQKSDDIRLFGLLENGERGYKYLSRSSLPKSTASLDAYKLFIPKAWGNMSRDVGLGGSYSNICLARPGDACTETFIEFGPFANKTEALNVAKYFLTKFFRACLFLAKNSQNTARDKYRYVPLLNFSKDFWQQNIAEIDETLFGQFGLPQSSRDFIRQNFQTRSEENIELL